MRCRLTGSLLALVLVALACSPSSEAPEGRAPGGGSSGLEPASAEWERVVAAAKREGKVSILGPAAVQTRDGLTDAFQRAYPEIEVELDSSPTAQQTPRLLAERAAGRYLVDLVVQGTTTSISSLKPAAALDPIVPYLVGPSTQDLSNWRDGALNFADNDRQYLLVFSEYVKPAFYYNPTVVSPDGIRSYRDLLDPRWKGKMTTYDPRLAGAGQGVFLFWYTHPALGKDFIRDMTRQEIMISRDQRQVLDWVARGQYPIALGVGDAQAVELMRRGLPIKAYEGERLAEGAYVTSGTGSVAVMNRPPHPNAAKVYLDFLLSAEGQLEWSQAVGFASDRLDVPSDHVEPFLLLKEGVKYDRQQNEPFVILRDELEEFLNAVVR